LHTISWIFYHTGSSPLSSNLAAAEVGATERAGTIAVASAVSSTVASTVAANAVGTVDGTAAVAVAGTEAEDTVATVAALELVASVGLVTELSNAVVELGGVAVATTAVASAVADEATVATLGIVDVATLPVSNGNTAASGIDSTATSEEVEGVAGARAAVGDTNAVVGVLVLTVIIGIELLVVAIAATDASVLLNVGGVAGIVVLITAGLLELVAEVVVVSTVVEGTEVVSPATIAIVVAVVVAERVVALSVTERVAAHADGVADLARDVLVALVAHAALLLTVVLVVVAGNGVKSNVDLTALVAPLVVDGLLGVVVVVGTPLVPGVVDPLVVALTLVARLAVRVVRGSLVPGSVAAMAVASLSLATVALGAVVLVVNTVSLSLETVLLDITVPGLDGNEGASEDQGLEHRKIW